MKLFQASRKSTLSPQDMCQMAEQVSIGIHVVKEEDVNSKKQKIWDVAGYGVLRVNLQLLNSNGEHKR